MTASNAFNWAVYPSFTVHLRRGTTHKLHVPLGLRVPFLFHFDSHAIYFDSDVQNCLAERALLEGLVLITGVTHLPWSWAGYENTAVVGMCGKGESLWLTRNQIEGSHKKKEFWHCAHLIRFFPITLPRLPAYGLARPTLPSGRLLTNTPRDVSQSSRQFSAKSSQRS